MSHSKLNATNAYVLMYNIRPSIYTRSYATANHFFHHINHSKFTPYSAHYLYRWDAINPEAGIISQVFTVASDLTLQPEDTVLVIVNIRCVRVR